MALTELGKTAHKEIQDKQVQQVIGFAGDGKLRDGGVASKKFRDFLALVPSSFLSRYANDCLTEKPDRRWSGKRNQLLDSDYRWAQ